MTAARTRGRFVKAVFQTPLAMADEAAGFLVARGALGCAIATPFKPGAKLPRVVPLEAFFARVTRSELDAIGDAMRAAGMLAADGRRPHPQAIVDPGWATMWMKRFKPLRIGRRWLIVPPWSSDRDKSRRDASRLKLIIEPGRAFGTGHHATTAGALRALERAAAERPFRSGLDVGTGSGILAIAMKLLGVDDVMGIDLDADALDNARENARLNHLERTLRLTSIPLARVNQHFYLITANILASTLIEMAPKLTRLLARDGRLILGGILAGEADRVLGHYRSALRCVASSRYRGWATLVLAR
jgi:ribosomal protein L11 methyltransferase